MNRIHINRAFPLNSAILLWNCHPLTYKNRVLVRIIKYRQAMNKCHFNYISVWIQVAKSCVFFSNRKKVTSDMEALTSLISDWKVRKLRTKIEPYLVLSRVDYFAGICAINWQAEKLWSETYVLEYGAACVTVVKYGIEVTTNDLKTLQRVEGVMSVVFGFNWILAQNGIVPDGDLNKKPPVISCPRCSETNPRENKFWSKLGTRGIWSSKSGWKEGNWRYKEAIHWLK